MLKRCNELNDILRSLCVLHNYSFIENDDISLDDLASDGVHLNDEGSIKLANNYLDYLNGKV